jgi:hypothetical protein
MGAALGYAFTVGPGQEKTSRYKELDGALKEQSKNIFWVKYTWGIGKCVQHKNLGAYQIPRLFAE